jgi:hypothetical protein
MNPPGARVGEVPRPLLTSVVTVKIDGRLITAIVRTWPHGTRRCPIHQPGYCHSWNQDELPDSDIGPCVRCQVAVDPEQVYAELFGDGPLPH